MTERLSSSHEVLQDIGIAQQDAVNEERVSADLEFLGLLFMASLRSSGHNLNPIEEMLGQQYVVEEQPGGNAQ